MADAGAEGIAAEAAATLKAQGMPELADVVVQCCERNPDLRPSAMEALAMLEDRVRECVCVCVPLCRAGIISSVF